MPRRRLQGMQALHASRERFDVVILDPPAFIKRKKDIKASSEAYRRLNEVAMRVLAQDAILVSCSCSYHLSLKQLIAHMRAAAHHCGRQMQIIGISRQAPDHPLHPAIPETAYLKAVFARLTRWQAWNGIRWSCPDYGPCLTSKL
jgi:23S rRNA (cytosine1962-C5)-methyltransferase